MSRRSDLARDARYAVDALAQERDDLAAEVYELTTERDELAAEVTRLQDAFDALEMELAEARQ
jgi:uncharacterized coiled-coil DUF342 family protein